MIEGLKISTLVYDVFRIILAGVIIFFVFNLVLKLIRYYVKSLMFKDKVLKVFILLEAAVWIGFIIWSINLLLSTQVINNPVILFILAVLFLLLVWFAGRDSFSGIILRLGSSLNVNQNIQTAFGSGRIKKLGLRTITIESGRGELFYIPYSRLASEKISYSRDENRCKSFEGEIKFREINSPEQIQHYITGMVLNSPYTSVKREPVISYLGVQEQLHIFRIVVFTLNEDYFNRLMFNIKGKLNLS